MIRIVTDSSCDLPEDIIERHRIAVVPLTIRFGDEEFVDREQLSKDDFWARLITDEVLPQTAAPSVGRFQDTFRRLSDEGADGVVVACISSKISATYQAAALAADQYPGGIPIRVIDSALVSAALGLVVIEGAEAAEAGGTIDEVEQAVVAAAGATNLYATLDTIEYLRRGGRIGSAQAFFGNLLDVKPIISFEDGAVGAAGRVRSRKKAVAAVLAHATSLLPRLRRLAVIHSDADDLAEFEDALDQVWTGDRFVARIGPVVGTHAGPGVIGVVYRLDGPE